MKKEHATKFELKTMSPEELTFALDWANNEGWNPGIYDNECYYHTDTKGFLMGEYMGRPIGCIAAIRYSDTYGFIGLFFVEEDFRKQWLGLYLARTALNYLGKRNIGLDGLPDRIETYKRIGFKPAYKIYRYECIGEGNVTSGITDLKDINFEELVKYDTKMFSTPRPEFLKAWINQPESSSLCILKNDKIKGYGVIRKCREGFKIGPLFADNEEIAEKLFVALSSSVPNEQIYMDVPEKNKAAINLALRHKMRIGIETIRMYSIKEPAFPVQNVYGFTSFELG